MWTVRYAVGNAVPYGYSATTDTVVLSKAPPSGIGPGQTSTRGPAKPGPGRSLTYSIYRHRIRHRLHT